MVSVIRVEEKEWGRKGDDKWNQPSVENERNWRRMNNSSREVR